MHALCSSWQFPHHEGFSDSATFSGTRNRKVFEETRNPFFPHIFALWRFFRMPRRGFVRKLVKLKMLIMSPTFDKFVQYRTKLPKLQCEKIFDVRAQWCCCNLQWVEYELGLSGIKQKSSCSLLTPVQHFEGCYAIEDKGRTAFNKFPDGLRIVGRPLGWSTAISIQ